MNDYKSGGLWRNSEILRWCLLAEDLHAQRYILYEVDTVRAWLKYVLHQGLKLNEREKAGGDEPVLVVTQVAIIMCLVAGCCALLFQEQ